jgi:type IV secretion system protein VirB8
MSISVAGEADYDSYFKAGATWEDETHRILRRSRSLAWTVTAVFGVIAGASLLALNLMLPLKQFEPYVIAVDKTTGFIEVARALKPGALSENEAVTTANLVRYVRARETYDPRALKDNYDLAQLYSTAMASAELERDFEPSNPNSKDKLFGRETKIEVTVKSVSFLNKNTATVRLQTITKRQNTAKTEDWVSVIRFRYTTSPLKNEYRFDNPLGFQVTDYRRDQESLPDAPMARDVSP